MYTYTHKHTIYVCMCTHMGLYVHMKFILTKCLIMEETHDQKSQELNLYTKEHKKLTKLHFL